VLQLPSEVEERHTVGYRADDRRDDCRVARNVNNGDLRPCFVRRGPDNHFYYPSFNSTQLSTRHHLVTMPLTANAIVRIVFIALVLDLLGALRPFVPCTSCLCTSCSTLSPTQHSPSLSRSSLVSSISTHSVNQMILRHCSHGPWRSLRVSEADYWICLLDLE
jgi:hypothetical protein